MTDRSKNVLRQIAYTPTAITSYFSNGNNLVATRSVYRSFSRPVSSSDSTFVASAVPTYRRKIRLLLRNLTAIPV